MTQYNSVNVELSNSQLIKLKLVTENQTGITLKSPSSMNCNTNDETNFYINCY